MRKIAIAVGTLGILAAGGILNASAQTATYVGPGYVTGYTSGPVVVEGRNAYVAPDAGPVFIQRPPAAGSSDPNYGPMLWQQPGDQAIINNELSNSRNRH